MRRRVWLAALRGCVQREKGQEKFDISLQKLDEDDAIEETAARIDAQEAEHFNYASVSTTPHSNQSTRFGRVWKAIQFKVEIFQALKSPENHQRYGKMLENYEADLENTAFHCTLIPHHAFVTLLSLYDNLHSPVSE